MTFLFRYFGPFAQNPQLALICATSVFVMSGVGLVAPILSMYAATFSASAALAGMIITLFGVGRLLINLPAGLLSRRYGKRALLIAGPVILLVGAIGAALASTLETLVLFRFVQGIGSGIYMTMSQALMAQVAAPNERGRIMSLYQSGLLVGTGLGPMVGGFLAAQFDLTAPFWAYAVVCVIATLLACLVAEPTEPTEPTDTNAASSGDKKPIRMLFADREFLLICFVNFGVFFTRTASQWQLIPLLATDEDNMSVGTIGLLLTTQALANFIILPISGAMIDRFGAKPISVLSAMTMAAGLLVIAFAPTAIWIWGGMAVLGIGGGLNAPALTSYAADIAPAGTVAPAMGLMRTWGDAGFVLGPIIAGSLVDLSSFGTIGGLLANAVLIAGGGIIMLLLARPQPSLQAACTPLLLGKTPPPAQPEDRR